MHVASSNNWLYESGVLTKRDMQNMHSGGGGTGIGNRWNRGYHAKK